MNARQRPLKPKEIAIMKRAVAFACDRFANSGRESRQRKPVTIRDYSKPSSNRGGRG